MKYCFCHYLSPPLPQFFLTRRRHRHLMSNDIILSIEETFKQKQRRDDDKSTNKSCVKRCWCVAAPLPLSPGSTSFSLTLSLTPTPLPPQPPPILKHINYKIQISSCWLTFKSNVCHKLSPTFQIILFAERFQKKKSQSMMDLKNDPSNTRHCFLSNKHFSEK